MGQSMPAAQDIDLQNLSSNWKRLQQDLRRETTTDDNHRKATEDAQRQETQAAKRKRTSFQLHPKGASTERHKRHKVMADQAKHYKTNAATSSASLARWATDNDISANDLAAAYGAAVSSTATPGVQGTTDKINEGLSETAEAGKYIAIDCEMVGVGPKPEEESALARVSIVNFHGHQLYDSFVLPKETVTDFRTKVSGITPALLQEARSLEVVQADVAKLLDGKVLVGHSLRSDLDALLLGHPKRDMRDTSRYPGFRKLAGGSTPGLKKLAQLILGVSIQEGEHSSLEDARAAMLLFKKEKVGFDKEHLSRWGSDRRQQDLTGSKRKGESKKSKHKKKRGKK